jgi:hypothetical protein
MYLGFALFLGTIMYFVALISIFIPKIRKLSIKKLNGSMLGDIFEVFDEGVDEYGDALLLALAYIFYMAFTFVIVTLIALMWPAILILGLLSLIIYKTNKNK